MKFLSLNQNICCDDVIQCIFNLNSQDLNVYKTLKKTDELRVDELAKQLKKERSTVYRSLQKLTCAGLVTKKTKNIVKGGYYHTYHSNSNFKAKETLENRIDEWYKKMKKTIKELEK